MEVELDSMAGKALGGLTKSKKGRRIGSKLGSKIGGTMGTIGGAMIPGFAHGGKVMAPKNKPAVAIIHGGEYVLPVNAKPTKAQKAIVAKNKKEAKKK